MLLKIQKRLIDLNYVYCISEVGKTFSGSNNMPSAWYYFVISFLDGGKDLKIMVENKKFYNFLKSKKVQHPDAHYWDCLKLYEQEVSNGNIIEDDEINIKSAREKLISYWNKSKSEIPEIKITESL